MKLNGTTLNNDNLYTMVSPKLAEEILERNTLNRPMRQGHTEKLAREMKEGRWQRSGEPVKIGEGGELYDGQHRLWAIVLSGMTVPLIIITNVPQEALTVIDTGLARSYGDYRKLSAKGTGEQFSYPNELAACLRMIHWYENLWPGSTGGRGRFAASHQELDLVAERHPLVYGCVANCASSKRITSLGASPMITFVHTLSSESYPEQSKGWIEVLKSGEAALQHPANLLREKLIAMRLSKKRLSADHRVVLVTKSWNAFAQGKSIAGLAWRAEEPIPAVFGSPQYTGAKAAHTAIAKRKKEVYETSRKHSAIGSRKPRKVGK